ncbi:heme exporter protein CcmD [Marinivivus vitaminiproducens]|uniref:heme exporter protein CcmD n=1 Tax=Marinivivus vitaminiproducens TaxID=3035935 RepID=UPI0027A9EED3|nr:heme exporter protein CcmD [Geminicoccaceae bacterium SCSIO 64248]
MTTFWSMGGYAAYVWSAFGFTLLVLGGLVLASWRGAREREAELAAVRREVRGRTASSVRRPTLQRQTQD